MTYEQVRNLAAMARRNGQWLHTANCSAITGRHWEGCNCDVYHPGAIADGEYKTSLVKPYDAEPVARARDMSVRSAVAQAPAPKPSKPTPSPEAVKALREVVERHQAEEREKAAQVAKALRKVLSPEAQRELDETIAKARAERAQRSAVEGALTAMAVNRGMGFEAAAQRAADAMKDEPTYPVRPSVPERGRPLSATERAMAERAVAAGRVKSVEAYAALRDELEDEQFHRNK